MSKNYYDNQPQDDSFLQAVLAEEQDFRYHAKSPMEKALKRKFFLIGAVLLVLVVGIRLLCAYYENKILMEKPCGNAQEFYQVAKKFTQDCTLGHSNRVYRYEEFYSNLEGEFKPLGCELCFPLENENEEEFRITYRYGDPYFHYEKGYCFSAYLTPKELPVDSLESGDLQSVLKCTESFDKRSPIGGANIVGFTYHGDTLGPEMNMAAEICDYNIYDGKEFADSYDDRQCIASWEMAYRLGRIDPATGKITWDEKEAWKDWDDRDSDPDYNSFRGHGEVILLPDDGGNIADEQSWQDDEFYVPDDSIAESNGAEFCPEYNFYNNEEELQYIPAY